MNFPLLRKLLWKIHFMLVYSSKTLDWIVTKQETWPGECEKSAGTAKPVGILERSVCLPPLAYLSSWTVTFSQQRGCPHCSCARWLGGGGHSTCITFSDSLKSPSEDGEGLRLSWPWDRAREEVFEDFLATIRSLESLILDFLSLPRVCMLHYLIAANAVLQLMW